MSCRTYDGIPKVHDEELRRTNDVRGMDNLWIPNKQIRYIIPIKV